MISGCLAVLRISSASIDDGKLNLTRWIVDPDTLSSAIAIHDGLFLLVFLRKPNG
jgi:hypothetical protein